MRDLTGAPGCDTDIHMELCTAGIGITEVARKPSEVSYTFTGSLEGWEFHRASRHWVAATREGYGIPEEKARLFNSRWRTQVRVAGYPNGADIRDGLSPRRTVDIYHIDTQKGLNAFADFVRKLSR